MKLITRLCLAASLAGILAGCASKQEANPDLSFTGESASLLSTGISAPATETKVDVTFRSALNWVVTAEDQAQNPAGWIVIHPAAGPAGDAAITITVTANPSMTARSGVVTFTSRDLTKTIQVTQAARSRYPITELLLSESSLELEEGDSYTLVATVLPSFTDDDKTVTWRTSNSAVATVVDGEVKALSVGKATITATAGDLSAVCTVTVVEKPEPEPEPIPVESVVLDQTALLLMVGESATLIATVLPENADDKTVTWTSNNPGVATVDHGVVTAVKSGTAIITAKAGTKSATCTVTVKAPGEGSSGENLDDDIDIDPWN